jgi:2-polyprenyl-3-methyl-5-hydroxy-6-metoxy-1,4-benzoquinol methylase
VVDHAQVPVPDPKQQWLGLLAATVRDGTFVKLTLSRPVCVDTSLKNVLVRPVALRAGQRLSFVFRHINRDITKNLTRDEGIAHIDRLLGAEFLAANLFTTGQSAQLDLRDGKKPRMVLGQPRHASAPATAHDRAKKRLVEPMRSPWLHALGVTTTEGKVCAGMQAKFRQINKFIEILRPLIDRAIRDRADIIPPSEISAAKTPRERSLTLVDMGCGKGYLTFAAYELLRRSGWAEATVRGIETRAELVELCRRAARERGFGGLQFESGTIESAALDRVDVLVALHACDTATDDAIAKGVRAGAHLILVAPCCQKELRPQLRPPPALAQTLKHGILRERQAEFVTDALRAALLEWAGYDTQVFEFISTEHTAKNLMIAGVKRRDTARPDEATARVRDLAAFYGIHSQRLAEILGFELREPKLHSDRRG